jgi:phosphohistidine phosphatase
LYNNNCKTDVLYSSYAKRAAQTSQIISEHIGYPKDKIIYKESLYLSSADKYFDVILEQNPDINAVMIVGHNPDITNVANFFVPDFTSYMQTGACYCIDFDTDEWTNIFTAERKVRFYVRFQ